eukprot:1328122-Ditylum_brightwellii.AAC.2
MLGMLWKVDLGVMVWVCGGCGCRSGGDKSIWLEQQQQLKVLLMYNKEEAKKDTEKKQSKHKWKQR